MMFRVLELDIVIRLTFTRMKILEAAERGLGTRR